VGKTKTLRVHTLAKEIGVTSKAILLKCHAEGIELKNHMAAIQIGLAASIREWFSEGADVTTVEVADHVDLSTVKKRRKKAVVDDAPVEDDAGGVATAEADTDTDTRYSAPLEPAAATAPDAVAAQSGLAPPSETVETVDEPVYATGETAEVQEIAAEQEAAAPVEPQAPAKPDAPVKIMPAGPQVVPQPAELKGPRVVRIEAPEPQRPLRPRRPSPAYVPGPRPAARPAARSTMAAPVVPEAPGVAKRGGAVKRGRGGREQAAPTRARSPRRHGNVADNAEMLREWRDQDVIDRRERLASATGHGLKARRSAERRRQAAGGPGSAERLNDVEITVPIMLKDLCSALGAPFSVLSPKLIEHTGEFHRITQMIGADTVELLAADLGISIAIQQARSKLEVVEAEFAARERTALEPRPPIVAMLGHVDHGKTSLLDQIRKANVAAGEAGGITQHIGAYRIDRGDWHVTFLDTPGHEAFTAMRARGANLTDVVVLVVAADDGVMPQTVEAINHAKAAGVQIVVALNKIDLPNVDLNKVYGQLAEHALAPAEWGGETDLVKTSATKGQGVDELIEHLSTLSELMDLKADPTLPAMGTVIEARVREGRGIVAQVMINEGTLCTGQFVTCGPGAGRVRSLTDDRGKRLKEAGPATPVEVVGLDELPNTGDKLYVLKTLPRAKEVANEVKEQRHVDGLAEVRKPQTLEDLLRTTDVGEIPELNVILRTDNRGSLEAVTQKLESFPADKVKLRLLQAGVGAITEADVSLATASSAVILGFHVVTDERAKRAAESAGVDVRLYRVIYEIEDDVRRALEGLLEPHKVEEDRGRVEVRQIFSISRLGKIAGCIVQSGFVNRTHHARLTRDGRVIAEGLRLESLRRFKDDAKEVRAGLECGVKLARYDDVKPGDIIEVYEVIDVPQRL
jgi:translation initiation factor IF-2